MLVGMGIPWGYYWEDSNGPGHFTPTDIERVHELAHEIAVKSGLLLSRMDFMKTPEGVVYVNEIENKLYQTTHASMYNRYYPYITKYMTKLNLPDL